MEVVDVEGRLARWPRSTPPRSPGDDDKFKLWIGDPNVQRAIDRVADEEALFAIALMHHPFEDLHPVDRTDVERQVERGFDLLLRGHLHNPQAHSLAGRLRGGFIQVAAPASYQGSQWGNGCFLGEIRPRARTVRLRPYMYASGPRPVGDWIPRCFRTTRKTVTVARTVFRQRGGRRALSRSRSGGLRRLRWRRFLRQKGGRSCSKRRRRPRGSPISDLGKQAAAAARLLADTPETPGRYLGKKGDLVLTTTLLAEVASKSGAKPGDILGCDSARRGPDGDWPALPEGHLEPRAPTAAQRGQREHRDRGCSGRAHGASQCVSSLAHERNHELPSGYPHRSKRSFGRPDGGRSEGLHKRASASV